MTAKEELGQLYRMKESIDCLIERCQQAQDLAYKITACNDGMPKGSGGRDKISNTAVSLADLAAEIEKKTGEYERLQREIGQKIARIENRDYRLLLELRYLNFNKFEVIAAKLGCSLRHVFRLNNEALREYEKIK